MAALDLAIVGEIHVTEHAKRQITARGMRPDDLALVLDSGRARESRTVPGRYIVQAGRDSLVVVQEGRRLVILTAIRDKVPGAALGAA